MQPKDALAQRGASQPLTDGEVDQVDNDARKPYQNIRLQFVGVRVRRHTPDDRHHSQENTGHQPGDKGRDIQQDQVDHTRGGALVTWYARLQIGHSRRPLSRRTSSSRIATAFGRTVSFQLPRGIGTMTT